MLVRAVLFAAVAALLPATAAGTRAIAHTGRSRAPRAPRYSSACCTLPLALPVALPAQTRPDSIDVACEHISLPLRTITAGYSCLGLRRRR